MKNETVIKDGKWVWPKIDENSWVGQNEFKELANKVMPHVKDKNIMIQAGGNCGFILDKFVDNFKIIYTFEPDPLNFYCLNQNITQKNVIKLQSCLGDTMNPLSTEQLIRQDRPHDTGGVHVVGQGYTPTLTIDSLNLPDCNLIQLDVEGYEFKSIMGGINTIKKYKPTLCIEFCEKWLNRYDDNGEKIKNLLNELSYTQVDEYGMDKIFVYV